MWYCSGTHWHEVNGKLEHTYHIKYATSEDGIIWQQNNQIAIPQKNKFEAIIQPTYCNWGMNIICGIVIVVAMISDLVMIHIKLDMRIQLI